MGGKVLSLSGSRNMSRKGGTYSSSFSRRFSLDPSLDTDHLTANLQNGVLTVSAPKNLKKIEESIKSIPVTEIDAVEAENHDTTIKASKNENGMEDETDDNTLQMSEENSDMTSSTVSAKDGAEEDTVDLDEKQSE